MSDTIQKNCILLPNLRFLIMCYPLCLSSGIQFLDTDMTLSTYLGKVLILHTWVITCHANFQLKYLFMLAISSTFLIVVKFPRMKKLTISRFRSRTSCSLMVFGSSTLIIIWRVGRFFNNDLYLWSISKEQKHLVSLLKFWDFN